MTPPKRKHARRAKWGGKGAESDARYGGGQCSREVAALKRNIILKRLGLGKKKARQPATWGIEEREFGAKGREFRRMGFALVMTRWENGEG